MKKTLIILAFAISCYTVYADGYQLQSSVFGGGATVSNSEYRLSGSVSQTNVGLTEGSGYSMKAGFWNTYLYKAFPSIFYPSIQASNLFFSNISRTGITVSWTRGNGDAGLLLGKESAKINATPLSDGIVYNGANSVYTLAPTVGGAKLLYNGTDANPNVSVSGLTKYKLYYFKVCEYNNFSSPYYLQTENATNPRSRWTLRKDEENGALAENGFNIYPNPAGNEFNYNVFLEESGEVVSELYSTDGRLVKSVNHGNLNAGENKLNITTENLPSGVYSLRIKFGEQLLIGIVEIVR